MREHSDYPLSAAAGLVAAATLLSGPIGFAITLARPQPPWTDAATYALHAHALQTAPYWAGFLLAGASILFIARVAAIGFERHRTRSLVALVAVGVYGALITLNYAMQVAYVPFAARTGDPALPYLTMTNPTAAAWVLEMFGYGVLGIATGVIAPIVSGASARRRWIRGLLRANGAISIAGAIVTAGDLAWVQTPIGLVAFLAWNILLIATMLLIAIDYAPPRAAPSSAR